MKLKIGSLMDRNFKILDNLSEEYRRCLGDVEPGFSALIWGLSSNGKSSFVMGLAAELSRHGKVLYCSLEEGHSRTFQALAQRHLGPQAVVGNITVADHTCTIASLKELLAKRQSPRFVIIDSLQYMGMTYTDYKYLRAAFDNKSFIFVSHANGNSPDGKTADKIRYDAGLKIHVKGYIAHIGSRYGGTENYVIWEAGAKAFWGKEYKKHLKRI